MDDISFENAPLIELVAELRWMPPGIVVQPSVNQVMLAHGRLIDKFYSDFGSRVAQLGYTQSERLIPSDFAVPMHNVVCRYKKPGDNSSLLQVGPGIFTANALRPYKRWSAFKGTVAAAVDALLATRPDAERECQFSAASLRYLNAFTEPLTAGKSSAQFISEVLGFGFSLPTAFRGLADEAKPATTTANMLLPIANTTKVMSIAVGDGMLDTSKAVLLDINVNETSQVAANSDAAMGAFNDSRDIIHKCFVEISKPIHGIMKPVANDADA